MTRADTGESTASIVARSDEQAWRDFILGSLESGATLTRIPKLRKSYADFGQGPTGAGISDTKLRKLERNGVIRHVGVDRYALAQR